MFLIKNIRRWLKGRATYNSAGSLNEYLQRDIGVQIEEAELSAGERINYVAVDREHDADQENEESEKDWLSRDGPVNYVG